MKTVIEKIKTYSGKIVTVKSKVFTKEERSKISPKTLRALDALVGLTKDFIKEK